MNLTLLSNRPKDLDEAAFKSMWNNSGHTLEALYKTLLTYYPNPKIVASDFSIPNHYEKLVWEAAQRDILDKVIALLPSKLTTPA